MINIKMIKDIKDVKKIVTKIIRKKIIQIICNVMKSCDQSRDGSNQIGTISDHY